MTILRKNQKKMKLVGKELIYFSFMLAAGVATGLGASAPGYLTASFSIVAASAAALVPAVPAQSCRGFSAAFFSLGMAFFFTGLYTASLHGIAEASGWEGSGFGFVSGLAGRAETGLVRIIDSLPFSDSGTNGLVKALITGERSGIRPETYEHFRTSGASHLLALSGMHLGVIYIILARVLSILGNSPASVYTRSVILTASCGFYTLMTGAADSTVRAFLFILLNETARCTGRARKPLNVFCAAMMLQLISDPASIRTAGFQLSYLAMAGIYLLYPSMSGWYRTSDRPETGGQDEGGQYGKRERTHTGPMQRIWNAAALSVSCQVFTAPAVWIYFGTFPQYFLITNLIAVPLTSLIISMSLTAILLHPLGICPDLLLTANEAAVRAMCYSLEIISSL